MEVFAACVASFVLGSIPFGLIVAKIFHVDNLRSKGSGNIGATNVSRVAGFWPAGAITFALDLSKGAFAIFLTSPLAAKFWLKGIGSSDLDFTPFYVWLVGLCAVLGHCYSPWLKFKGGKGVATSFGVLLVLSPIAAVTGLIGFIIAFFARRIGSLASIAGVLMATITYVVINPYGSQFWIAGIMIFVVLLRHSSNISSLLAGTEKVFE